MLDLSKLTWSEKQQIYREVQREYLLEDVASQCEDAFEDIEFTDIDYEDMVDMYLEEQDCNVAENDTWSYVINMFIKANKE